MRRTILIICAMAGWAVLPLIAAEPTARYALVMGNASYDGEMALANPANDARAVASALQSIGWTVVTLVDGDRRSMNRTIFQFRDALAKERNPVAMLFYAGHGMQIGGNNYLIPVKQDFETADDVVTEAISLQSILDTFDEAKVSTSIVVLDACRDNPFAKKGTRSFGGSRGLGVVNKSSLVEGSAVLFATAPGDTAADGTGSNGVFTSALIKYLTTDISLQVLAARVTGEVKRLTGGKQTPYSSLSLSDEFFMVPESLRTAKADSPAEPVPVVPVLSLKPTVSPADLLRATQNDLQSERGRVIARAGVWPLVNVSFWTTALGGLGIAGWQYFGAQTAFQEYQAATTVATTQAARERYASANALYKVGLVVGVAGLGLGVTSLFFLPNTATIDEKLARVSDELRLMDASRSKP